MGLNPFDLHALSTPPAFILSQDQTLNKKPNPLRDDLKNERNKRKNKKLNFSLYKISENILQNDCVDHL